MNTNATPERPAVMDDLSETQMQELEFQASEYDVEQFKDVAGTYGWDADTVDAVWNWFEVQNNYPLDSDEE